MMTPAKETSPLENWLTGYSEANNVVILSVSELGGGRVDVFMEPAMATALGNELVRLATKLGERPPARN